MAHAAENPTAPTCDDSNPGDCVAFSPLGASKYLGVTGPQASAGNSFTWQAYMGENGEVNWGALLTVRSEGGGKFRLVSKTGGQTSELLHLKLVKAHDLLPNEYQILNESGSCLNGKTTPEPQFGGCNDSDDVRFHVMKHSPTAGGLDMSATEAFLARGGA
ncbi:hypothetical protein [Streptomyces sp. NPDC048637]|uniref:hypothetical protein n=1 Tax=Streptomyces sp. NPDC048637 TaxID=3155636 RepID=UPI003445B3CE